MKRYLTMAAILVGCGSDPVDAEGTWTIAGTNRDNGCNIGNWNVGESWSNVTAIVTQSGDAANADVTGGAAFVLYGVLGGDDIFSGSVDGNELDLERQGTKTMSSGNCTYTYNAQLLVTVDGDVLTGRLNYRSAHNGNSDCAAVTCLSYQDVNGTRPPQ